MKTRSIKEKIKVALSVTLFACIMMSLFSGCGARTQRYALAEDIITSGGEPSLSTSTSASNEDIAVSGLTKLMFDTKTCSPVIQNQGMVWRALPKKLSPSSKAVPAVFTVECIKDGQRYVLNSQSDCVKINMPERVKTDSGVCVGYILSLDTDKESIKITVPVNFYLEDGSFYVSIDCKSIKLSDDIAITKISLMDYFGSNDKGSDNDYIFVPDNCGAIIQTAKAKKDFADISFKVYGDTERNNAMIGAFGMKRDDSAYVAIIESGDAIASVNAAVAVHSGYNKVGASFEITQTSVKTERNREFVYVSGKSYSGEIKICYRFIEGNKANYSGMAIACREHLIRTGVLSADTVGDTGDLPFVLTTVGEAPATNAKNNICLTGYEQLLDMLTYLKGKGFSNIYIRYKGALTGGLAQGDISNCKTLKTLGTQESFKELTDYVDAQQMKLFFDIGLVSAASGSMKKSDCTSDLNGDMYAYETTDLLGAVSRMNLAAYGKIEKNVIDVFKIARKNGISNICINDAGEFLYSDPENGATRADIARTLREETASLPTVGGVMIQRGNFYVANNADVVSSLPLDTSVGEKSFYKSIPFIPLLLHATTLYTSEPLNLSGDYTKAALRCIEYGALPQFEWCYEDFNYSDEFDDESEDEVMARTAENEQGTDADKLKDYSYADWATAAYTFYEKANRALGDIRDLRMTAHYKVKAGVSCTEYGETKIYVNYTDEDVTVGGVTIAATDFMRVN